MGPPPPGGSGGAGGSMDVTHSRGSDAGSVKDNASDTGSNAGVREQLVMCVAQRKGTVMRSSGGVVLI